MLCAFAHPVPAGAVGTECSAAAVLHTAVGWHCACVSVRPVLGKLWA